MNEFLIKKLQEIYENDTIDKILNGLSSIKKTTFRTNTLKCSYEQIDRCLNENNIIYDKYNKFSNIYVVDNKYESDIKKLNIYNDGLIYLQSISSILPAYIINPKEKENILDMCAAPGGKTTLIAALTNNKSNITAVELHKDRFERLKFNIEKQNANAYLININATDLNDYLKFDKILLDAPCSGSGIININDEKYQKYFTEDLIKKCVKTQKGLIKKSSKLLKSGGVLVYSTCSLLKEENEEITDYALNYGFEFDNICENGDIDMIKVYENVIIDDKYIKIIPSDIYEGFFVSRLIKK